MKSSLLLIIAGVANAKTAAAAPDPSIVDELKDCVLDVVNALLGGASDVVGYLLGLPRFSADLAVWAIEFVRGLPALRPRLCGGGAAGSAGCFRFARVLIVFIAMDGDEAFYGVASTRPTAELQGARGGAPRFVDPCARRGAS